MVEHFHPKRDINTKNWALDWNNLLGCCTGGTEANGSIFPRPDNLSCDKYKEIALPNIDNVEGELINPIDMPAFPCLFNINKFTGKLSSDKDNCESFNFSSNNKKRYKRVGRQYNKCPKSKLQPFITKTKRTYKKLSSFNKRS